MLRGVHDPDEDVLWLGEVQRQPADLDGFVLGCHFHFGLCWVHLRRRARLAPGEPEDRCAATRPACVIRYSAATNTSQPCRVVRNAVPTLLSSVAVPDCCSPTGSGALTR